MPIVIKTNTDLHNIGVELICPVCYKKIETNIHRIFYEPVVCKDCLFLFPKLHKILSVFYVEMDKRMNTKDMVEAIKEKNKHVLTYHCDGIDFAQDFAYM